MIFMYVRYFEESDCLQQAKIRARMIQVQDHQLMMQKVMHCIIPIAIPMVMVILAVKQMRRKAPEK